MVGVIIKQPVLPLLVTKVTPERSLEKRTGVWERERTREREKTMCVYIYIYTHTEKDRERESEREPYLGSRCCHSEKEVCTVPNATVCAALRLRTPAYAMLPFSIKEGILGCFLERSNVGSWANKQTFSSGRQWPNLGKNSGFPTAV